MLAEVGQSTTIGTGLPAPHPMHVRVSSVTVRGPTLSTKHQMPKAQCRHGQLLTVLHALRPYIHLQAPFSNLSHTPQIHDGFIPQHAADCLSVTLYPEQLIKRCMLEDLRENKTSEKQNSTCKKLHKDPIRGSSHT